MCGRRGLLPAARRSGRALLQRRGRHCSRQPAFSRRRRLLRLPGHPLSQHERHLHERRVPGVVQNVLRWHAVRTHLHGDGYPLPRRRAVSVLLLPVLRRDPPLQLQRDSLRDAVRVFSDELRLQLLHRVRERADHLPHQDAGQHEVHGQRHRVQHGLRLRHPRHGLRLLQQALRRS